MGGRPCGAEALLSASQLTGCRAGRGDAVLALFADGDTLIEHFRIVAGKQSTPACIVGARRSVYLVARGNQQSRGNRKSQSSHDAVCGIRVD
jgi:hypothetical protein